MRSDRVSSASHRTPSHNWEILLIVDSGLGIQALLRSYVAQSGIGSRLLEGEGGRVCAGVVADEVQVLTRRGGNTERLLHQTVGLVSIAIRTFVGTVASFFVATSAVGGLPYSRYSLRYTAAASLALHLTICQKAA